MYFDLDLDIKKYRYKAVIDFVSFEFETKKATNGFTIKRNTNLKYVDPLNKGSGSAATRFLTRIYDVSCWSKVEKDLALLKSKYPLINAPKIVALEVSLDAYSKANSREELIQHVCYYFWCLQNPVSDNRRIANKSALGINSYEDLHRKVKAGGTLYLGNQKRLKGNNIDPITMRIYLKDTDRNMIEEDIQKHRARIEITLVDNACPFNTMDEAKGYKFSELSKHFRFRKFKENIDPLFRHISSRSPKISERRVRRIIDVGTRVNSQLTLAHTKLNRTAYDSLRNLTRGLNKY